ncbi:MAG: hypothetical protein ACAI43_06820, partial [Phycisphaerae bacterium]
RGARRSRLRSAVAVALRGVAQWVPWRRAGGWVGRVAGWIEPVGVEVHAPVARVGGVVGGHRCGARGRAVWAEVLDPRGARHGDVSWPEPERVREPFLLLVRSMLPQQAVALTCRPLVPRSRIAVSRRHPGGRTALLYVVRESRHVGNGVFRVMLVLTSRLYRRSN